MRGPSQSNLGFSILKRFNLTESKDVEFHASFFNGLNHSSRSNPVGELSNATLDPNTGHILDPGNFARILGTSSCPRLSNFCSNSISGCSAEDSSSTKRKHMKNRVATHWNTPAESAPHRQGLAVCESCWIAREAVLTSRGFGQTDSV